MESQLELEVGVQGSGTLFWQGPVNIVNKQASEEQIDRADEKEHSDKEARKEGRRGRWNLT